jgi:hypothetical protein
LLSLAFGLSPLFWNQLNIHAIRRKFDAKIDLYPVGVPIESVTDGEVIGRRCCATGDRQSVASYSSSQGRSARPSWPEAIS